MPWTGNSDREEGPLWLRPGVYLCRLKSTEFGSKNDSNWFEVMFEDTHGHGQLGYRIFIEGEGDDPKLMQPRDTVMWRYDMLAGALDYPSSEYWKMSAVQREEANPEGVQWGWSPIEDSLGKEVVVDVRLQKRGGKQYSEIAALRSPTRHDPASFTFGPIQVEAQSQKQAGLGTDDDEVPF